MFGPWAEIQEFRISLSNKKRLIGGKFEHLTAIFETSSISGLKIVFLVNLEKICCIRFANFFLGQENEYYIAWVGYESQMFTV